LAKGFELKKEEQPTDEIHVRAPAKINLILRVLDRLPNGYHRIWSVMNTVDLADRLAIRQIRTSSGIRLSCHDASVPQGNNNLVHRAAEFVLKQAGLKVGLEIDLDKQIPMAAGLGGGSSDAAATIVGLVRLLNLGLSLVDMAKLGSQLGSDVAFFFSAPSALVCEWGRGVQKYLHVVFSKLLVFYAADNNYRCSTLFLLNSLTSSSGWGDMFFASLEEISCRLHKSTRA